MNVYKLICLDSPSTNQRLPREIRGAKISLWNKPLNVSTYIRININDL